MSHSLSLIDIFENPQHSTKKELRAPGSAPRKRPPKLNGKRCLNRRLFSSRPTSLLQAEHDNFSRIYDETLNVSYFDQCFQQIAKIGEGSFGEVYKVVSKEDGRYYAIKRSKECFRGECDREDKIAEVHKHERIPHHENIISLLNAWEQDDYVYMQMELGETSLELFAESNHDIPEQHLWNILLDMLLALKILHENNFVHLDVKLENIIIYENGSCKLGDFGLMLNLKGDMGRAMEGDAKYLAPELMEGKFTKAADVFSLGISMLELASDLELPSRGKLWHDLRNGIFPDDFIKNVSCELLNIIRRMMTKDFKKRPSIKSLLKHPRLKSLLKQRRESAAKSCTNGQVPSYVTNTCTSLPSTPPRNGLDSHQQMPLLKVVQATPPFGYSTPDINKIFNTSSLNNSIEFDSDVEMQACLCDSPTDLVQPESFTSPLPTRSKPSSRIPVYSSAKKLNFVYDV